MLSALVCLLLGIILSTGTSIHVALGGISRAIGTLARRSWRRRR